MPMLPDNRSEQLSRDVLLMLLNALHVTQMLHNMCSYSKHALEHTILFFYKQKKRVPQSPPPTRHDFIVLTVSMGMLLGRRMNWKNDIVFFVQFGMKEESSDVGSNTLIPTVFENIFEKKNIRECMYVLCSSSSLFFFLQIP